MGIQRINGARHVILIVDDAPMNRALLVDMLGDEHDVLEASTGVEAIAALQDHGSAIDLVLLDIVMPEMDGLEVLAVMNRRGWIDEVPVIMVSSERSPAVVERAYALGATDFINRPFDTAIVRRRVTNTLMLYAKQKALVGMVEDEIRAREKSVSLMVSILSQIVEFRNGESGLHVLHVNVMTEMLLNQVAKKTDRHQLTPAMISSIAMASSLHDIGKIAIPEEVLNKPGKLTDEEFALMKRHSAIGADMLKNLPDFESEPLVQTAYEICRWHHERFDGQGYPDGLAGDAIPLSAQVVALADVYDALTSQRVYKDAIPHEQALQMILGGECGAFDPFLLGCLQDIAPALRDQLGTSSTSVLVERKTALATPAASIDQPVPSQRTLDLLDYERMKYAFFARMSNEVQFEYTVDPPVAVVSDWGVSPLGLDEVIRDPVRNAALAAMFGADNVQSLACALRATTADDPVVQFDLKATVDGEPRWFHLAARAMWTEAKDGPQFQGAIGKLVDVHESRQRLSELERRATHDSLTGAVNHDFARKAIGRAMRDRPDAAFVLIILDMDHFKEANDSRGHLFGDEVLKHLAARLRASVRDDDVVARVGGDEFLICMEVQVDPAPLVQRIHDAITGDFQGFPVSASMGAACAKGGEVSYDQLFRWADGLLYSVKRAGRGGWAMKAMPADFQGDAPSALSAIEEASFDGAAPIDPLAT